MRRIFNSLLTVWKYGQTLYFVFDILRQKAWKLLQGFILVQVSYVLRDVEVHNV